MEYIELVVGEYTFSALADGPVDGELVLLLHGFPETSYEWRAQIPALAAAGYRVVAPDQRGYAEGARPANVDDYGILALVGDAVGFVDALGASTCHLVGHDWGGAVAWVLAVLHPDRLRTLTAVSTPHPTPFGTSIREGEQKEMSAYMDVFRAEGAENLFLADDGAAMRQALASFGMEDTDPVDEYYRVLSEPGAMTGALNWYRANDFSGGGVDLPPVTVPTMYVWSTDDQALGREAAEATAAWVEGPYRFEVLEGVSHWVPEEVPDVLTALLLEHFGSV
jgi:pimeloyl-ACP methyl ester carboxylesterase